MSINNPGSRLTTITALALATCVLGLGQILCAGLMPSANPAGILSGAILFAAGIVIWNIKRLWSKESARAYLNFLTGALFLIVAINGALGLGIAEHHIPAFFVWTFVTVSSVFFFLGWSFLRTR